MVVTWLFAEENRELPCLSMEEGLCQKILQSAQVISEFLYKMGPRLLSSRNKVQCHEPARAKYSAQPGWMRRRLAFALGEFIVMRIFYGFLFFFAIALLGAYVLRADLPLEAQTVVARYVDRPAVYPNDIVRDRPSKITDKASLERWLLAAIMCDNNAILDVQNAAFMKAIKKLGVRVTSESVGSPVGEWVLPPGIRIFSSNVEEFFYWGDSGAVLAVTINAQPSMLASRLGAKPAFFLGQEDAPVVFSEPFNLYEDGMLNLKPYTYMRGHLGKSILGCTHVDI